MKKDMRSVIFGFGFIFAMFHPVERHVGAYFNESGSPSMGLLSLVVGYFCLFIGDFLSPFLIARWGPRKSMVLATLAYTAWVVSVALQATLPILMGTSALIGLSAAVLWNSMASYVLRVNGEDYDQVGKDFASIISFYGFAAGCGLVTISWLVAQFGFKTGFLALTPFSLVAICFLLGMKKVEIPRTSVGDLLKTYSNGTVLRLATLPALTFILFGLLVSVIPLHIQKVLGIEDIGWLSSGAFFTLLLCRFFGGWATRRNLLILLAYPAVVFGLTLLLLNPESAVAVVIGTVLICIAFALFFLIMFTLADCAPPHMIEKLLAVFTSADDITVFSVLLLSLFLERTGHSLSLLYGVGLGFVALSSLLVFPLMKGGYDLDEAKARLAKAFPEESPPAPTA